MNPRMDALLAALPHLDEDAHLTISVRVGDLRLALARTTNPLRRLTPQEASAEFGYTRRWWQGQAPDIPNAVRDGAGRWRIPFAEAERHVSLARNAERREERFGKAKAKRAKAGDAEREVDGGPAAVEGSEVHDFALTVPPTLARSGPSPLIVTRSGAVVDLVSGASDADDLDLELALAEHPPESD